MYAMEKAASLNSKDFWLESDSLMMVRAMNENSAVPWSLSERWNDFKALMREARLSLSLTSIGRKHVADALAKT